MTTIMINGEPAQLPTPATVADLVESRYGDRRFLAVAVEGEVVPRSQWQHHPLEEGAAVEVLTAVQGG